MKRDEARIWRTGLFTVDEKGFIWREGRRAESILKRGQLRVRVTIGGVRYQTTAQRLIWYAVRGVIPKHILVSHKNGKPNDNRIENLELINYSRNVSNAFRWGSREEYGENNPSVKLCDREIEQIRACYFNTKQRPKMWQLAKRFKVCTQHISRIIKGKRRLKQEGIWYHGDLRRFNCPLHNLPHLKKAKNSSL